MKKINSLLLISTALFMSACSSTYKAGTAVPDDIYYSASDQGQPTPAVATYPSTPQAPAEDYTSKENNSQQNDSYQDQDANQSSGSSGSDYYQDGQGNTYITNNYYNDDYYDYSYSSRLRRYYSPAIGYSYYDPYYTNSYYYDYYPSSWGVSIYSTYNWWAPSYYYSSPFCYGGVGISIGYSPIFTPWYSPWYYDRYYPGSYYHGYYHSYNHGYYHGYNDGYAHGYYDGYYGQGYTPYYYNSRDAASTYYGPRGGASTNTTRSTGRQSSESPMSLGEKYEVARESGRISNVKPEGLRNESIGNQNAGEAEKRGNTIQSDTDRNSTISSPAKTGETREMINQNQQGGDSRSGEIKRSTDNSGENSKGGNQIISKPTDGDNTNTRDVIKTSKDQEIRDTRSISPSNDSRNSGTQESPNRENKNVRDLQKNNEPTKVTTPANQEIRNDNRQDPNKTLRNTDGLNKSDQIKRDNTPRTVEPVNPSPRGGQEVRPEKKTITPAPTRKKENETLNTSPSNRMEENNNNRERTINSEKQNQYTSPTPKRSNTKNVTPRQDTRTPIVQPRNEPRQYKQENINTTPQRNSSPSPAPSQSRPSQNDNKRSSNPRR